MRIVEERQRRGAPEPPQPFGRISRIAAANPTLDRWDQEEINGPPPSPA